MPRTAAAQRLRRQGFWIRPLLWMHACLAPAGATASAEGGSRRRVCSVQIGRWKRSRNPGGNLRRVNGRSFGPFGERHHRAWTYGRTFRRTGSLAAIHLFVADLRLAARGHRAVRIRHGEGRPRRHCQGQSKQDQGEQAPHGFAVNASRLNRQLHCFAEPVASPASFPPAAEEE